MLWNVDGGSGTKIPPAAKRGERVEISRTSGESQGADDAGGGPGRRPEEHRRGKQRGSPA
eukprot:8352760-Prorocentrum_lima.AAC.1